MLSELYIASIVPDGEIPYQDYISKLPLVRSMQKSGGFDFNSSVTFFVGENGTGKSTLLEALAVKAGFNPEGGSKHYSFSTAETHSDLFKYVEIIRGVRREKDGFFLRAESFYNAISYVDELDKIPAASRLISASYGGRSLHNMSHGEGFITLAQNRFGGNGLYILDEPEAALSPLRQMSLMSIIKKLADKDSQFIIATHSPVLMAYPGADIFVLDENGIKKTPYEQTEHYTIMKRFIDDPERMIRYMFESDESDNKL